MYLHLIRLVFQFQTLIFWGKRQWRGCCKFFFKSALQCIQLLQSEKSNTCGQERLYRVLDDHTQTLSAFHAVSRYDHNNRDVNNLLGSLYTYFCNFLHEYEARQRSTDVTNRSAPVRHNHWTIFSLCVHWFDKAENCIMLWHQSKNAVQTQTNSGSWAIKICSIVKSRLWQHCDCYNTEHSKCRWSIFTQKPEITWLKGSALAGQTEPASSGSHWAVT